MDEQVSHLADSLQVQFRWFVVQEPVQVDNSCRPAARLVTQDRSHPSCLYRLGVHYHHHIEVTEHSWFVVLSLGKLQQIVEHPGQYGTMVDCGKKCLRQGTVPRTGQPLGSFLVQPSGRIKHVDQLRISLLGDITDNKVAWQADSLDP